MYQFQKTPIWLSLGEKAIGGMVIIALVALSASVAFHVGATAWESLVLLKAQHAPLAYPLAPWVSLTSYLLTALQEALHWPDLWVMRGFGLVGALLLAGALSLFTRQLFPIAPRYVAYLPAVLCLLSWAGMFDIVFRFDIIYASFALVCWLSFLFRALSSRSSVHLVYAGLSLVIGAGFSPLLGAFGVLFLIFMWAAYSSVLRKLWGFWVYHGLLFLTATVLVWFYSAHLSSLAWKIVAVIYQSWHISLLSMLRWILGYGLTGVLLWFCSLWVLWSFRQDRNVRLISWAGLLLAILSFATIPFEHSYLIFSSMAILPLISRAIGMARSWLPKAMLLTFSVISAFLFVLLYRFEGVFLGPQHDPTLNLHLWKQVMHMAKASKNKLHAKAVVLNDARFTPQAAYYYGKARTKQFFVVDPVNTQALPAVRAFEPSVSRPVQGRVVVVAPQTSWERVRFSNVAGPVFKRCDLIRSIHPHANQKRAQSLWVDLYLCTTVKKQTGVKTSLKSFQASPKKGAV